MVKHSRSPGRNLFLQWGIIFTGFQCGSCLMSRFWRLEFWVVSYIFFTVAHNIYGFSVWILSHVTFLAPRILSRFVYFFTVAHNIYGFSVWILSHVTFLAPRILNRFLYFWENSYIPGLSNWQRLLNNKAYKKTKSSPPYKSLRSIEILLFIAPTSFVVLFWYFASLGDNWINLLGTKNNLHYT